jgi:hypothetical protein
MWRAQERLRRQNIAVGFLLEIESMEKMLSGYANMFSGPTLVKVDTPIYPPTGLYRLLQREVFSFDAKLARSLFQFYSRVLEAEQLRSTAPNDPRYRILQEGVGVGLTAAVRQLPELKESLTKEARTGPTKIGNAV